MSHIAKRLPLALIVPLAILIGCFGSPKVDPGKPGGPITDNEDPKPVANQTTRFQKIDAKEKRDIHSADQPSREGWVTEVEHGAINGQLKQLAKVLSHLDDIDERKLAKIVAADFSCQGMRPDEFESVFKSSSIQVQRSKPDAGSPAEFHGPDGLVATFRQAVEPLGKVTDLHLKFKTVNIELSTDAPNMTRQLLTITGAADSKAFEQHWKIKTTWIRDPSKKKAATKDGPPKLVSLGVESIQEIQLSRANKTLFRECTESALKNVPGYENILRGVIYWQTRLDGRLRVDMFGHQGIAVADVNGDGLDDLYLCQAGGLPNSLLIQNSDGTVKDTAKTAGVDFLDLTMSALFADLDNDGDQDLVLCTRNEPATLIMSNDGRGHFKIEHTIKDIEYVSPTVADYDHDGDLDIYVLAYSKNTDDIVRTPSPMPIHDANNGGRNAFFRNDIPASGDDWEFVEVTEEVGLDVNNRRYSFAASWADYDDDGDDDVYVANDWGRNNLYRNDGGKFTDVTEESGAEDGNFGMSVCWGDYNLDGKIDLYVGNMFSSAGNRIVPQSNFKAGITDQMRSRFLKLARGNSLLKNIGGGKFDDVSNDVEASVGRWAWSSLFTDINNDGWPDLVVANGFVTHPEDTGDL